MTDIFTPEMAARIEGEVLQASLSWRERLQAAKTLSRYDFGGELVHQALLSGLHDPSSLVRIEIYRGLARQHYDSTEDLLEVANAIRHSLELEDIGSSAWHAGIKVLDKLGQQAKALAIRGKVLRCLDK